MPDGSGQLQPFLEQALAGASSFAGAGTGWVDALRKAGADAYAAQGLPRRRDEYWRYTNLNALAEAVSLLPVIPAISSFPICPWRAPRRWQVHASSSSMGACGPT